MPDENHSGSCLDNHHFFLSLTEFHLNRNDDDNNKSKRKFSKIAVYGRQSMQRQSQLISY